MNAGTSSTANEAIQLDSKLSWADVLKEEKAKPYFKELLQFVESERASGKTIYPPNSEVFNALKATPFESLKVVIVGQDPYHGPNQAHGLSFSVKPGIPFPPSLRNIFQELSSDLQCHAPTEGCLTPWAEEGVLMLNAVLTVERGNAGSHAGKGWETFTDEVLRQCAEKLENLVFILWGSYAQKKGSFIDPERHLVLKSPHPSPLSAHRGFFGSKPFSTANDYLSAKGRAPVQWSFK